MIKEREKEYEDGLLFGGLGQDQKRRRQNLEKKRRQKHEKGQQLDENDMNEDYKFD